MALLLSGVVQGIRVDTKRPPEGASWSAFEETTLIVADFGATHYVVAGRDLKDAGLPAQGESVVLEVGVRPFARKDGTLGCGFTASRRGEASASGGGVRAVKATA